jgi:hypothetical protein
MLQKMHALHYRERTTVTEHCAMMVTVRQNQRALAVLELHVLNLKQKLVRSLRVRIMAMVLHV